MMTHPDTFRTCTCKSTHLLTHSDQRLKNEGIGPGNGLVGVNSDGESESSAVDFLTFLIYFDIFFYFDKTKLIDLANFRRQ